MTLQFPDVSQYTPNVDPAKYPAIIARATLSNRVADPTYGTFKAKAQAAGTVFAAYHWLNHGNLKAQAAWCFKHVGPGVPVMIDAEDVAGNTGYNGPLTVDDLVGFKAEYLALGGGPVNLGYLPFWYWAGAMGAPHTLDRLTAAGIHLVSSNYPNAGYTENGPGWALYYPGAPAPVQWQYTSTPIDMNAFRGTVADFAALIGASHAQEDDMPTMLNITTPDGKNYGGPTDGFGQFHWIGDMEAINEWKAGNPTAAQREVTSDMARRAYGINIDDHGVYTPPTPPPAPVTLTDADRQAIIAGVTAQLGGKVEALTTLLTHVERQLAAAGHALSA